MSELDVQNFSREELEAKFIKCEKLRKISRDKMYAYSHAITSLTDRPAKDFIFMQSTLGGKEWRQNKDVIVQFKQEREKHFQEQISQLNSKILSLQEELNRLRVDKECKLSSRKNTHEDISLDIKTANDDQTVSFSRNLQKNFNGSKEEWNIFRKEQSEIEINIINSCIENLRQTFDRLPKGIIPIDIKAVEIEINPLLEIFQDARVRLSYFVDESKFVVFLKTYLTQAVNVLSLFNSRHSNQAEKHLTIPLTAYEKRLLVYNSKASDSYLACYERPSEIQQRAFTCRMSRSDPSVFTSSQFQNFPSYLLFIQPEEAIRIMMITTYPINNLVFIQQKNEEKTSDSYSFYALETITPESRSWKLDAYASQTSQSFQHQYLQNASQCFRKFYQDVFGHNKYLPNFEKILDDKIERWKQMKILSENIRIVSDEYLLGKLVRSVLFSHASYFPEPEIDIIIDIPQPANARKDFKAIQERWKKGLSPVDQESEEWLNHCFDSYKSWSPEQTSKQYQQRWTAFLQSAKFH